CDGDHVEASNLHRQTLYDYADVGRSKAEVAAEKLRAQNPFITVVAEPAHWEAASTLARDTDVVLDCTDNFAAKFSIHDACQRAGVPLVMAALYQFEGQLHVFRPGSGAGCLRCIWPDTPEDGCVGTCADVGVLGVVPGVLGTLQATEALKLMLGLSGVSDRDTVLLDLLTLDLRRVARDRHPDCPLCGRGQARVSVRAASDWLVDARELKASDLPQWRVVDIRGFDERAGDPDWVQALPHVVWTDLNAFARLDPESRYLLACAHGVRSRHVVASLREAGYANFYSLRQGIEALARLLEKA
ncbi:MAG: ThiF family adenylyltransferase, partial [Verrucomicrobia bacterium]|nr:ThiF family adenylyltransferase [Verrucomicrobiota bacterium]